MKEKEYDNKNGAKTIGVSDITREEFDKLDLPLKVKREVLSTLYDWMDCHVHIEDGTVTHITSSSWIPNEKPTWKIRYICTFDRRKILNTKAREEEAANIIQEDEWGKIFCSAYKPTTQSGKDLMHWLKTGWPWRVRGCAVSKTRSDEVVSVVLEADESSKLHILFSDFAGDTPIATIENDKVVAISMPREYKGTLVYVYDGNALSKYDSTSAADITEWETILYPTISKAREENAKKRKLTNYDTRRN